MIPYSLIKSNLFRTVLIIDLFSPLHLKLNYRSKLNCSIDLVACIMAVKDVTSVNVTRTFKLVVEQLPVLILYLSKKKFLLPLWNFKEKTF